DAYLNGYNGCSQTGQRQHEAPMIGAILRLLSSIALATAVIMAVLDATRSIAAEQVVFTSLGQFWATVSRPSLEAAQDAVLTSPPAPWWDPMMIGFLQQPGCAVFAVLALLLALAGRRTPHRRQFAH